jgi:hypothetical protein
MRAKLDWTWEQVVVAYLNCILLTLTEASYENNKTRTHVTRFAVRIPQTGSLRCKTCYPLEGNFHHVPIACSAFELLFEVGLVGGGLKSIY